jgi:hypothetical protein
MLRGLVAPAVSGVAASLCYLAIIQLFGASIGWMCAGLAGGLLAYGLSMMLIDRRQLGEDWSVARRIISRPARDGGSFEPASRPSPS